MTGSREALADLLAGRDKLELRHAVHCSDVRPVRPVLVALMHAVDPDITRPPIRLGALAAGDARGPRLGPVPSRALVLGPTPQVIQMGDRNPRQPLEARILEHQEGPFHQLLGGRARHGTMPRIHVGQ